MATIELYMCGKVFSSITSPRMHPEKEALSVLEEQHTPALTDSPSLMVTYYANKFIAILVSYECISLELKTGRTGIN